MAGQGPLAGIRIIEMDAIGPVPLCGMILAGLGADIVRIARPGGHGAYADVGGSVLHRQRMELALDLRSDAERERLLTLIERADGLMEGARPGVMERLGLGPDTCLSRNPGLIYGRMTGWGQTGPLSQRAGHDLNYLALTGALHAMGTPGEPPPVPLNLVGDYGGGAMFLALGMVSALLGVRNGGQGQVIDAAMVDGVANLLSLFHGLMASGQWRDERGANLLDGAAPFYRCYACKDGGHVAVGALEPQFFARLLEGLGIETGRFDQNDVRQWPVMADCFASIFRDRTRDDWADAFLESDACVTPVLSLAEAMEHPVNKERNVFCKLDGIPQPSPAPRFSQGLPPPEPKQETGFDDLVRKWVART